MTRFVARCPSCRGRFPWDKSMGLPSRCPLPGCDYVKEDRGEVVIAAPFIGRAQTKATDDCYRQLEKSSEVRAQMAADMAGVPVSEMSHMKVTNLRDNAQVGEIQAMPVSNEVTKQMDLMKARGMPVGFGGLNNPGQVGVETGRQGLQAMELIQRRFAR